MRFIYIRIIMAVTWIICACIWGDIKNWRKYYPTMLFFGFGDLIYHLVFKDKLLWCFKSDYLVPSINELFVIFTIFFSTTLLFISNLPEGTLRRIQYITFWVVLYIGIELFATSIGMQKNHNGWNIWWSILHNTVQFPLLLLHHRKPVLAWVIAFVFLGIVMKSFGVPAVIGVNRVHTSVCVLV